MRTEIEGGPAIANLILKNGKLLTMSAEAPYAEALSIGPDGRIIAVGADSEIVPTVVAGDRIIDLRGRTLIPGFFDCHLHLLWLGSNLGHVSLASPPVRNHEDILRMLLRRLQEQPGLTCVQGIGYDQNRLPGGRHLTRYDLDRITTELPVRIEHTSGHAAVVNSRALRMLGITRDTDDPVGGEIVRDKDGEPTGLLLETACWENLERILPERRRPDALEALKRAETYLLERGITSAGDAHTAPEEIAYFAAGAMERAMRIRVNCMVGWAQVIEQAGEGDAPTPDDLQPHAVGVDWHWMHVGQAKLFSDGAITTRTCWLNAPFEGMPDNCGIPLHPPDELLELIIMAHNAGWQIATHAIGDRAIDLVLVDYAEAQRRRPRYRPGHRIEHCMLLNAGTIARLRRQNVWSIGQPEFLARLGDAYLQALGEARAQRLSPYATLETQNVAQAFSSDCPVVPGAPLDGIRAAIERRTRDGRILNAGERVSPETALYAYTAAPAYATRTERDRGVLEAGKWADLTLLSQDPLKVSPNEWEQIQVEATFVAGRCLYGAEKVDERNA